jgi:Zn-dependent protease with chaperone function
MIRPISLFLLIGIIVANREATPAVHPNLFLLLLLLVIAPALSIVVARLAKKTNLFTLLATFAVLLSWIIAVYFLSWAALVRSVTQNVFFVGDIIVVLPAIFWLLVLWFVTSPISNRLSWVSHRLRLDILLLLIPLFFLLAASNITALCGVQEEYVEIVELLAFLILLALAPFFITKTLSAKPMNNYELSSSIADIGRSAGVRQSKILVWDTHNRIMNALAVGVIFQPKTVVLTDKLIANLTPQELRAVAAHEFGHHKYWHIPFLILTTVSVLVWSNKLLQAMRFDMGGFFVFALQLLLMVFAIIILSRFFERQADAYAAVALSKASGNDCVTLDGANSLGSALGAIAQAQHIHTDRNDPFHGSIASRQQNLHDLVGCSFSAIPINAKVFWIKIIICVSLILGLFA